MELEDIFPFFALAASTALVLALIALFGNRGLRAQLASLGGQYRLLNGEVARLAEQLGRLTPPPSEPAASAEPAAPDMPEAVAPAEPAPPEPAAPDLAAPTPSESPASPAVPALTAHWEQLLVENWLVWLGGATLALGGAFLVKLSIDYGLLTPLVRVALGVALGVVLSFGGEWLRRRELAEAGEEGALSYVPQALAAAGAATVFASVYAAHALYGLIPSGAAFVLLAATAGLAVGQSLRQGPYVAALGLAGAYAVPLLVSSETPHAFPLFAYLAVVTAGALAVLRHRAWWWLAWLSLAGALLWVPLWLAAARDPEAAVVAGYLLVQFGLFVAFRQGIDRIGFLAGVADDPVVRVMARSAFWAIAAGLLLVAHADRFGMTSVGASFLLTVGLMALAYRDDGLDDLIATAGALALALLASWNLPLPIPDLNLWVFRVEPDHVTSFAIAAVGFAALLGAGGFRLLPRVARPGRWAAVSAAVPLAVLVIAYWRLQKFELDIAWTLAALALAGLELGAAASVTARRTGALETEIALAAYAVGVLGSTILAATLALGEAWLTVALALHLPAMGWIEGRIRLPALRWLALGVAAIVIIRLVLNPYVVSYQLGPTPILNWLLYGYGVPAAAFIVATRQFGSSKDDALVGLLEAGSILFTLSLLTLELIHAIYGRLVAPVDDFSPTAALLALWLVFAAALIALGEARRRPVLRWGGIVLLVVATAFSLVWQFVSLAFGADVGNLLIFDGLLLADAVPAVCFAAAAWTSRARWLLPTAGRVLAAVYGFAWVTLEIRHAFQGEVALFVLSSEAEWYTYSVVWLVFAGAMLAVALIRRNEWLRRAGLLGVGLVVAKVFLSDLAALDGVLRALSFIGLGLALVGLGYAYRRLRPLEAQAGS